MQVRLLGGAPGGDRVTPVLSPGRGAKPWNISELCLTLLVSTFSPHSHVLLSALSLLVTSFPGTPFSSVLVLTVPWSRQLRGSWPPPLHTPTERVHGRSVLDMPSPPLCLFMLFMGFWQQEYWSGVPSPRPVDHVLSEVSAVTRPSRLTLHLVGHCIIELCKPTCHNEAVIHEGEKDTTGENAYPPHTPSLICIVLI